MYLLNNFFVMDLKKTCLKVCSLCKETGELIKHHQNQFSSSDIKEKGIHNYVTYVDKLSERTLTKELLKMIPEAGFIVEENTIDKKGEKYNWIVDPLDGTTNFIHSLPIFAISIALMKDDEVILGVVYEINFEECFYAWQGSKAFLNDKEIHVSETSKLDNSLLATGFPYYDYQRLDEYLGLFKYLMKNTQGLRRWGSAATDLAYVACGRFDGFYEYGLSPWDVAAGAFIVKQAGGIVNDFKGENNFIFGKEIIAANNKISDEINNTVKNFF